MPLPTTLPTAGSPHPLPSGSHSPFPVEALPGTWQISEKPAGKSVQMRPSKRVGRDGEVGPMTPGLALLCPSLMFPANNPVNAQEQLWKLPAPHLRGVWECGVPAGEDSPEPATPASPFPGKGERGLSCKS